MELPKERTHTVSTERRVVERRDGEDTVETDTSRTHFTYRFYAGPVIESKYGSGDRRRKITRIVVRPGARFSPLEVLGVKLKKNGEPSQRPAQPVYPSDDLKAEILAAHEAWSA